MAEGETEGGGIAEMLRGPRTLPQEDFSRHPVLRHAPFVRGRMRGRPNVTEYWPYIYDMILRRNRDVRNVLQAYEPR